MCGVVTSGTNRILSVGELLRTVVVVLKHAFTKEAHCTPYTQKHQSLVLTSAMDKVPVKVFLFHSCTVYLCITFALLLLPLLYWYFNNKIQTGEGREEKPHQGESYGLVHYKTTLHVLHLLVHLVYHDLHAHVHQLKIKQLLVPHLLNKLLQLAKIKLDGQISK